MKTAPLIPNAPRWLRQRVRSDGSVRIWWEPNGPARAAGFSVVELDEQRLTWSVRRANELNREADRALQGQTRNRADGRTIDALIALYTRDPMFTDKAEKTQAGYRGHLRIIAGKWGPRAVAAFDAPVMREWYLANCRERGKTQAARLNATMSILFTFAKLKGWRRSGDNPCSGLKVASTPSKRHRVATWAELDACVAAARDLGLHSIAMACRLSCLQGQSQSNIIVAAPAEFREVTVLRDNQPRTVLAWDTRRTKTGKRASMQIHPELEPELRALLALRGKAPRLLIEERLQEAYHEERFQRRWIEVRATAARRCPSILATGDKLQFRDFRRTFAVWARIGGSTVDDVGGALANSVADNPELEGIYMPPSFESASRAVQAVVRPENDKRKKA